MAKRISRKIVQNLDIPSDIVFGEPRITVLGNERVWVENHTGILKFTNTQISFKSKGFEIVIEGEKLDLIRSETGVACIAGEIVRISLEKRGW